MAYPMGFPPQGLPPSVDTRTSTIVVAASNSLDPTLAPAAYRCSGVADNVEMNAALVAAAAVNGSVELLEGDYNTVLTLSVAVNVTLKAVGWGAVINFNAGGHAITIAGDNVKLRDFKVVIVAGAGEAGTRPNAVYATGRTNVEITKLWLYGDQTQADDGVDFRQCGIVFGINMAYCKITFCTIENFDRNMITLEGTSGNEVIHIEVEGNICHGNGLNYDGISLEYAFHCTVTGNTCQDNPSGNINLEESSHNTVAGNTCQGSAFYGIFLWSSDNNTLTGNTCQGNGNMNIYLLSSSHNTVAGNTCKGSAFIGIFLESSSDNNTVAGNICSGGGWHGINLDSSDGNTVTGNTCFQNTRHGIYLDTSSNNTLVGNTCNENDVGNSGNYDGINLEGSTGNIIGLNTCKDNDRWGIMVDADSDFNKVSMNYTSGNTAGSIRVNNANCDKNQIEWNTVEEGAPTDVGTGTRGYGNYDPSADTFFLIGAAPW